MDVKIIPNKIIIIGGDHHNTLAVIRDLGKYKCNISVLVHGKFESKKMIRVSHSKYAQNCTFSVPDNEQGIIDWLLDNKKEMGLKPILFPCSDLAAYVIDSHYKQLSPFYILPGFINNPGRVAYLMDKKHQKEFAEENGIPMARTWELKNTAGAFCVPEDAIFPCIIKPEISAFGNKADIKICQDETELKIALALLANEGYEKLILQQFLKKEYEVCAYGCLINQHPTKTGGGNSKTTRNL